MITFYMEIALLHISLLLSDLARLDIPTFINHKTSNHPTVSISVHTHPAISTRGFLCCETFYRKKCSFTLSVKFKTCTVSGMRVLHNY